MTDSPDRKGFDRKVLTERSNSAAQRRTYQELRMNTLHKLAMLASFAVATATMAQTPTQQQSQPNPSPSTSPAEGTAADSTPPGQTQTQGSARDAMPQAGPATDPGEGTAADRTAPQDRQKAGGTLHPELVGAKVVSPANQPIGEVVDVVFDSRGQPDYVVIASEGNNAAVPYKTASSMIEAGKVIIDEAKLQNAPKIQQGQWRNQQSNGWKQAASGYWDEGEG